MRGHFCVKFYTTVKYQVYTSPSSVKIHWRMIKLCYFNQDNPQWDVFTSSLWWLYLIGLKKQWRWRRDHQWAEKNREWRRKSDGAASGQLRQVVTVSMTMYTNVVIHLGWTARSVADCAKQSASCCFCRRTLTHRDTPTASSYLSCHAHNVDDESITIYESNLSNDGRDGSGW